MSAFTCCKKKRTQHSISPQNISGNTAQRLCDRCVREDTKQALKGNLQADGVQSRQTLFVRYCQRYYCFYFSKCRFSAKYCLVSIATTPDRAISAMTFGNAIRPLKISAVSHTASTVRYGPMNTATMYSQR